MNNKNRLPKLVNTLLVTSLSFSLLIGQSTMIKADKATLTTKRLVGANRIATSLAIASAYTTEKIENVVITTENSFPDALSGSVLAYQHNAPILLVGTEAENTGVLAYLTANLTSTGTVYILGGVGAVSKAVENSIKALGFNNIVRLEGTNRIDTNLSIVSALKVSTGTPVIIATGYDFPDALSISTVGASKGYPILLSNTDYIDTRILSLLNTIKPTSIYIVGGPGVVSSGVEDTLKAYSSNVLRIAGTDRYSTSLAIADYFKGASTTNALVATGIDFPDALSGSILGAKLNAPIILVDNSDVSKQKAFIDIDSNISSLYVLGGTGAISDSVVSNLTSGKASSITPTTIVEK